MDLRDEIVEEVRAAREAYAARFNFDLKEMCKDLKAKEQAHSERIAAFEPIQPRPTSRLAD